MRPRLKTLIARATLMGAFIAGAEPAMVRSVLCAWLFFRPEVGLAL
jgi:hypothetical protein